MVYRIDVPTAATTPPSPGTPGPEGFPTGGSPGVTPSTIIDPYWAYAITEELRNIAIAAGITPKKSVVNQVALAIQSGKLNYQIDTSIVVNTIEVALSPVPLTVGSGMLVAVRVANSNTGPTTLIINGFSFNIIQGGADLRGTEILASWPYLFLIDNGSAHLIGSGAGAVNGGNASEPSHFVTLGQFPQLPIYNPGQSGSIAVAANTSYNVSSIGITFPSFSKSGKFRVRATLIGSGATTAANVSQNFSNELSDGTNEFTGAPHLVYAQNVNETFGISDSFTFPYTYAPGETVTFTQIVKIAGGSANFSVSGCSMLLEVIEA